MDEEAAHSDDKPVRRLDARSLRGLAHPLRMNLLEMLALDGPATATVLSARLGENTGTVSWHLRNLADHGFIREDEGRGTRRERWWRIVEETRVVETVEFRDDPDTRGALSAYVHQLVHQHFARVTRYLGESRSDDWQRAGMVADWSDLRLTPEQLATLNEELAAVVARHTHRSAAEPSPGALPVIVQIQSFPREARTER